MLGKRAETEKHGIRRIYLKFEQGEKANQNIEAWEK